MSSSRRLTPLQRTGAPCLPLPLGRDAFHGVAWSLFATSIELVRHDGVPLPPPFRPRRFGRPRRLAPCSTCQMYFNPAPRTGFSLQGFPLLARPYQLVAGLCPLGVALRNRYRRLPVRATIRSAALRALLHTRIHRPTPRCLAIAPVMIPSWDSPPPGSQLPHHGIA